MYILWGPYDASRYLGFGEYMVVIYFGQYKVGLQEVVEVFRGSCSMIYICRLRVVYVYIGNN